MSQIGLFGDLARHCEECGEELPLRGRPELLCLPCENVERGDRDRFWDLFHLEEIEDLDRPVPMWRWAVLRRQPRGLSMEEQNVRRAWERLKTWLQKNGAPVDFVPSEEAGASGRKDLVLRRGIKKWLRDEEKRLLEEDKAWAVAQEEDL